MDDDNAAKAGFKIGVTEYYIAKRAGKRLVAYMLKHRSKMKREADEKKKKTDLEKMEKKTQEEADLKRRLTKRRRSLLKTSSNALKRSHSIRSGGSGGTSENKDLKDFVVQDGEGHEDTEELEENVQKQLDDAEERRRQQNAHNSNILEDDDESYEEAFNNFLKEINNDTPEDDAQSRQ